MRSNKELAEESIKETHYAITNLDNQIEIQEKKVKEAIEHLVHLNKIKAKRENKDYIQEQYILWYQGTPLTLDEISEYFSLGFERTREIVLKLLRSGKLEMIKDEDIIRYKRKQ